MAGLEFDGFRASGCAMRKLKMKFGEVKPPIFEMPSVICSSS